MAESLINAIDMEAKQNDYMPLSDNTLLLCTTSEGLEGVGKEKSWTHIGA